MIVANIEKQLKTYKGQQVLKVACEFPVGSITKVYGPSGSGKTTFLKIIAGFIKPEKGSIIFNHTTWLDTSVKINLPTQTRQVGFVFQDYALFPNMTVNEHLEYATNDKPWINLLLEIGKLQNFIFNKPEYLSGGQQQRLAILRALAVKPKLLLMDEPFSALDPEMKKALICELSALFKELGTTVFIVTHNPDELVGIADHELSIL